MRQKIAVQIVTYLVQVLLKDNCNCVSKGNKIHRLAWKAKLKTRQMRWSTKPRPFQTHQLFLRFYWELPMLIRSCFCMRNLPWIEEFVFPTDRSSSFPSFSVQNSRIYCRKAWQWADQRLLNSFEYHIRLAKWLALQVSCTYYQLLIPRLHLLTSCKGFGILLHNFFLVGKAVSVNQISQLISLWRNKVDHIPIKLIVKVCLTQCTHFLCRLYKTECLCWNFHLCLVGSGPWCTRDL